MKKRQDRKYRDDSHDNSDGQWLCDPHVHHNADYATNDTKKERQKPCNENTTSIVKWYKSNFEYAPIVLVTELVTHSAM